MVHSSSPRSVINGFDASWTWLQTSRHMVCFSIVFSFPSEEIISAVSTRGRGNDGRRSGRACTSAQVSAHGFSPPLRSENLVQFPCRFHHDAPGLPAIQRAGALDAVLTKQMHETIMAATAAENAHLFPVEKRIEVAVLPERLRINQLFESVPADDFVALCHFVVLPLLTPPLYPNWGT